MDSAVEAEARVIYEAFQADHLTQTPLAEMAAWLVTGSPPGADDLRDFGFSEAGLENAGILRHIRKMFVRTWGFSIPCAEAVEALSALGPLVEVGAGTGYWTAILRAAGADVVATDVQADGPIGYGFRIGRYVAPRPLGAAEAVRAYPGRDVFCSWPTAGDGWALEAAQSLDAGRHFALIGAPGTTGDDALYASLSDGFEEVVRVVIPQFPRVRDDLRIYRRL